MLIGIETTKKNQPAKKSSKMMNKKLLIRQGLLRVGWKQTIFQCRPK
jgi:hypothetical protein